MTTEISQNIFSGFLIEFACVYHRRNTDAPGYDLRARQLLQLQQLVHLVRVVVTIQLHRKRLIRDDILRRRRRFV